MPTPVTSTLGSMLGLVLGLSGLGCERGRSPDPALEAQAAPTRTAAGAPAGQTGVKLGVARSPILGPYVTDARGRALYLLEPDGPSGGCFDGCLGIWPPLVTGQALPEAGDSSLVSRLLGTTKRRDGLMQATYGGHALYYYSGDREPGQTLGQHVEDSWGEWYLVSPAGTKVRDPGERRGRDRRERDE